MDNTLFELAIAEAEKVEPLKSSREVMQYMQLNLAFLQKNQISGNILEIGVKKGKTTVFLSNILSEIFPDKTLYSFDPFSSEGAKKSLKKEANDIDNIYKVFLHHTKKLKNHTHFKKSSEDLNLMLPDVKLMMSFIDGEHTFDAVMRDFANVFDLTVIGGIIAIDDYQNTTWPGVPRAYKKILDMYKDVVVSQSHAIKTVFLKKVKHVSRSSI